MRATDTAARDPRPGTLKASGAVHGVAGGKPADSVLIFKAKRGSEAMRQDVIDLAQSAIWDGLGDARRCRGLRTRGGRGDGRADLDG